MKQLLAILKDSYREARDAKVIYVMVVVSVILMLLIATIHYRPLSMQEAVSGGPLGTVNRAFGIQRRFAPAGQALPPVWVVENLRQTNDATEPWLGSYEFELVVRWDKPSDKDAFKAQGAPLTTLVEISELYNSDEYYFLKGVRVTEQPATPTENRFRVTVEGTRVADKRSWLHEPEILFGVYGLGTNRSIRSCVYYVEKWFVHEIGSWVAILVGVVITSFFVPSMLRKGTIDLLIAKPIHRVTLLIYKYIGGLTFMFAITTLTVGGVWLAVGISTGIWTFSFLWVIPAMVFYFAILYAVSTTVAVFTRSPILAILVTCVAWVIFYANGLAHGLIEQARDAVEMLENAAEKPKNTRDARRAARRFSAPPERAESRVRPRWRDTKLPGVSSTAVISSDVLYTLLPRTSDLDDFTANIIGRKILSKEEQSHYDLQVSTALYDWYEVDIFGGHFQYPVWLETLFFSVAFIALLLGLSCWRIIKMNF